MASVKPLKKNPTTGVPRQFQSDTDFVEAAGFDLEGLGTHLIKIVAGALALEDPIKGLKKISDLLDAEQNDFDPMTSGLTSLFVGPAIRELTAGTLGLVESFTDDPQESTTSNGWVTKNNYPYVSAVKPADTYVIDFYALIGQSDKEKKAGSRLQWRPNNSGSWTTLFSVSNGVSTDDEFDPRSGFREIVLGSPSTIAVRWQFGDTDEGGTCFIKDAGIKIARKGN